MALVSAQTGDLESLTSLKGMSGKISQQYEKSSICKTKRNIWAHILTEITWFLPERFAERFPPSNSANNSMSQTHSSGNGNRKRTLKT